MNAIRPSATPMAASQDQEKLASNYIADLRNRIDSLRTHFYHIESEFNAGFQSYEQPPTHHGFAELGLLGQLLTRYRQCRDEAEMNAGLNLQRDDVTEAQTFSNQFKRVSAMLADLGRHDNDANPYDCYEVWQQTSDAFLKFIAAEAAAVEEASGSKDA